MWRSPVAALIVVLLLSACGQSSSGSGAGHSAPQTASSPAPTTSTAQTTTPPVHHHHRRRHHRNPGRLPQTIQKPSASSPQFHHEMAALFRGVRAGRVKPAMASFFPEAAYAQVKAIGNAASDWQNRLVGDFAADISAAHALLGAGASSARLIDVRVPGSYAHWVTPDTCYNRVGYWETPNSRLVYREHGQVRSFGIASMISWRGVWYVVHLGAVLRSGAGGVVDDPSSGQGYSAPSSTC